jgi:hypothetical protein
MRARQLYNNLASRFCRIQTDSDRPRQLQYTELTQACRRWSVQPSVICTLRRRPTQRSIWMNSAWQVKAVACIVHDNGHRAPMYAPIALHFYLCSSLYSRSECKWTPRRSQSISSHIGYLPVVASCKDLGVSYDDRLSLSPHIRKRVAKLILKRFRSRDSQLLVSLRAFCTLLDP